MTYSTILQRVQMNNELTTNVNKCKYITNIVFLAPDHFKGEELLLLLQIPVVVINIMGWG